MGEISAIDEVERRLRADLDQAEKALRQAPPEAKPEARRRFKDALHRFTVFVFTSRVEPRSESDRA